MNPFVWLMLGSVIAVAALFIALAVFLFKILSALEGAGGTGTSYLAKVRMGLRAIEIETGHIPTEVTALNGGLTAIRAGLEGVDGNLRRLLAAVQRQEVR